MFPESIKLYKACPTNIWALSMWLKAHKNLKMLLHTSFIFWEVSKLLEAPKSPLGSMLLRGFLLLLGIAVALQESRWRSHDLNKDLASEPVSIISQVNNS
jgi:hypothetical protein